MTVIVTLAAAAARARDSRSLASATRDAGSTSQPRASRAYVAQPRSAPSRRPSHS